MKNVMEPGDPPEEELEDPQPLDQVRQFVTEVLYATDAQIDVITLVAAVSHNIDLFTTVPRVLAVSDLPESGKTTVLDIGRMLSFQSWAADPTSYALRAKFNNAGPGNRVTLIQDELDKIFGESGLRGRSNPLYKLLVESYRRTATLSLSVDRVAQDVSSYNLTWAAGLQTAAPRDLRSRSIILVMRPAPPGVTGLRNSIDENTDALGAVYREMLRQWVQENGDEIRAVFRDLKPPHKLLRSRLLQIWGPLFAVAQVAGDTWPQRVLQAFREIALDVTDRPVLSPQQMILRDVAGMIQRSGSDRIFAASAAAGLRALPEVEIYQVLSSNQLARLMSQALGTAGTIRKDGKVGRGWYAEPILTAWGRLEKTLEARDAPPPEDDPYDTMLDEPEEDADPDGG